MITRVDWLVWTWPVCIWQCILHNIYSSWHITDVKNDVAKQNGEDDNLVSWSCFIISIFILQCPFMSLGCKKELMKSCLVTYKLKKVINKVKVCQKTLNHNANTYFFRFAILHPQPPHPQKERYAPLSTQLSVKLLRHYPCLARW